MKAPIVRQIKRLTGARWLNLFCATIENRGNSQEWFFASRRNRDQPTSRESLLSKPDGVLVVALVKTPKEYRLLVTQEFRPALCGCESGLPGGVVKPGETVIDAAARELLEETGLRLSRVIHRSPPVISTSSVCDEVNVIVWCEAVGRLSTERQSLDEHIGLKLLDLRQLDALVRSPGAFIAARLYCVAAAFLAAGRITPDIFCVSSEPHRQSRDKESEVIPIEQSEADLFVNIERATVGV